MANILHRPVEQSECNLSYYCRKCSQKVRGIPLGEPQYQTSEFYDQYVWLICRCPSKNCELSFVIYDKLNDRIRSVYPYAGSDPEHFHSSIPLSVREDIAEADRCYFAEAYRATLAMYRRALQNIILNKIPSPEVAEMKLYMQIDQLQSAGFITKDLRDTAHEIRHFGNFGAHPTNDKLDMAQKEDVDLIRQLVFDIIGAVYIGPHETAVLKSKRTKE